MAEELDVDSIFKFKVDELKQELTKRGLAKSGSKADLQERLLQYVTSQLYTNESGLTDTSVADTDEKLTNSLDTEDNEVDDPIAECSSKHENSIDGDTGKAEVLSDDLINNVETPNDTSVPDIEDYAEYRTVDQTDFTRHTSPDDDASVPDDEHSSLEHITPTSETKFCRVTITSPEISEGTKKENRSKRFGAVLPESETERKKSRLGRFSSMGLGQGEAVTEEDIEKIKKRAERFGAVSSILTNPVSATKDRLQSRQERFADANLKKRQERFGITQAKSLDMTSDMEVRKQNRLSKFGAI